MPAVAENVTRGSFIERYGGIYEHSAWIAEQCYDATHDADLDVIAKRFAQCVDESDYDTRLKLIRAHPDLAGRAAIRGELTIDSSDEQASAGIDQCSQAEYKQFVALNSAYKEKFGFPFVMAVRGSDRHKILSAFAERIGNDPDTEFATAIREIHKIARLRLEAMKQHDEFA